MRALQRLPHIQGRISILMIYAVFAYKPNANPLQIITFCQVWIEFYGRLCYPTFHPGWITVEQAAPAPPAQWPPQHKGFTSGHRPQSRAVTVRFSWKQVCNRRSTHTTAGMSYNSNSLICFPIHIPYYSQNMSVIQQQLWCSWSRWMNQTPQTTMKWWKNLIHEPAFIFYHQLDQIRPVYTFIMWCRHTQTF